MDLHSGELSRSGSSLNLEIMVSLRYGRLLMAENEQSLICRATLEFDKRIFMGVLFSMCGVIGFSSRTIFDNWLFCLSVSVKAIQRIQVVLPKGAIDESTLIQVQ